MSTVAPRTPAELAAVIVDAAAAGTRLEIRGGGSKASMGAPARDAMILDMRGFSGIVDYDPAELVLTVGVGTPLADVEALVAGEGQMLAFEPFDYGTILGVSTRTSTIGGVVAAGVAGSRRLTRGGVRDHLLGFAAVSGRGEAFVAGGKVVKNVTGYDLPKLLSGSWGRLAALTEVTLKVLPAPLEIVTVVVRGLAPAQAYAVMSRALGSQAEVSAAAYLQCEADTEGGIPAITALRLEGFGPSVAARLVMLERLLGDIENVEVADSPDATAIWNTLKDLAPLAGRRHLWRLSVPPRTFPGVLSQLASGDARWLVDWAGGLVWLAGNDTDSRTVRRVAEAAGGHAVLIRGDQEFLASVPTFHPQPSALAALEARIRRAFDPAGVFATGRFGDETHAD